ncbi:MAG: Coenzyme F420 hydrogenase/dehydrogenase, beta subunit C-terminal domain [Verrucomicrobiota bacterium]|nr:Coenzyme F420 hydrogenase/dehydrogenase, beta subunit C-terminal domain [Verrucomicrobiota bacterium]
MNAIAQRLLGEVVRGGICTGCGACVALDPSRLSEMTDTELGPVPSFHERADLPDLAWAACPGKGYDYLRLHKDQFGTLPTNWLLGNFRKVRTGYAADPQIRRRGASGGALSATLLHLLETGRIDAAVIVRQHVLEQETVRVKIARAREEILNAAGSIYAPVSTLDILRSLNRAERYAMTCLPDQAAALRRMQLADFAPARQIRYLLGPYTGTAMYPGAVRCFLRSHFVPRTDRVMSLRWRAGEWPGHLEIRTAQGRILRAKKFHYNYLIPFFVTQASLQSGDFTNEFCDLSAGDAWSPRFEAQSEGYSVLTTRSKEMEEIIVEMIAAGRLVANEENPLDALGMHGHMLDFKKRGSYIRNRTRRFFGRKAPDYGVRPRPLPRSRWAVECVIMAIFTLGGTRAARFAVGWIPSWLIGPLFALLRRVWKAVSKPAKRKGLRELILESE